MSDSKQSVLEAFLSDLRYKVNTTCVAAIISSDDDKMMLLGTPLEIIDVDKFVEIINIVDKI